VITPAQGEPGVHLVGSVPLADAESVFRTVANALGPHLRRIPDGETGERRRWIYFQRLMLERHPAMEVDPTVAPFALRQWDGKLLREMELLRFRAGVDPETVVFETGYAVAARKSYAVFRTLQADGVIPPGVRFQVCLPTPMASAYMYVSPKAREAYVPAYERALRRALGDIVEAIPAAQLAIQWDVCQEVLVSEGFFADRPADYEGQIASELARLGDAVPDAVEVGYHLCYGSPADEHLVMPRDTAIMVEIANGLRETLRRRVDFLHMPVPRDRADAAYFAPLADLAGYGATTVYVGLIHHADRDGDRARIRAARAVIARFGVASECGWGRTDPQRVSDLLAGHREAADFLRSAP
jgi:methionine synthase II (cobalamin-independent)